ncbi:MAG: hypothetical protein AAB865_02645 [Patescibacteria group bacterium]
MIPSFPIALFLIPYALFLLVYGFFLFFNLYHLRTYGIKGTVSHGLGTLFLVGTVVILGASWIVLSRYDWGTPLNVQDVTGSFTNASVLNPYDRSEPTPQP